MNPTLTIPAHSGQPSTRPTRPVVFIDGQVDGDLEVVEFTTQLSAGQRTATLTVARSLDPLSLPHRNQMRAYLNRLVQVGWNITFDSGATDFKEFVAGCIEVVDSSTDSGETTIHLVVRSAPIEASEEQAATEIVWPELHPPGPIVDLSVLGDPDSQLRAEELSSSWSSQAPLRRFALIDHVVETTVALVKGWDPAGQGRNPTEYDRETSSEFSEVVDVFRHWVLNDDGEYSIAPYLQTMFDSAALFALPSPPQSPLRFGPMLTRAWTDPVNRVRLEYRTSPVGAWIDYPGEIALDRDRAGVRIVDSALPSGFATAGNAGTLEVLLTATLKARDAIERSRFFGNPLAGPPIDEQTYPKPTPCYAIVHESSQFKTDVVNGDLLTDERDDRNWIDQWLLAAISAPTRDAQAQTSLVISPIDPTIEPGTRVGRVCGDQWVLDMTGNARRLPIVSRVRHRFGKHQHTEIELSGSVRALP